MSFGARTVPPAPGIMPRLISGNPIFQTAAQGGSFDGRHGGDRKGLDPVEYRREYAFRSFLFIAFGHILYIRACREMFLSVDQQNPGVFIYFDFLQKLADLLYNVP